MSLIFFSLGNFTFPRAKLTCLENDVKQKMLSVFTDTIKTQGETGHFFLTHEKSDQICMEGRHI